MTMTPEQHQAVHEHHQNLIVVAGAGSGKTFVLVERYLAMLAANPDWPLNALVAVTFTRKAAGEMRDRVRQELVKRARTEESVRWIQLLATIDTARIDTIHGLCAKILRANAPQARLDPGFRVLDAVESAIMREEVVERVIGGLLDANDPATRLFEVFDIRSVREILIENMSQPVPKMPADSAAISAHWGQLRDQLTDTFATAMLADPHISGFLQWISSSTLPAGDKMTDLCRALYDALQRFATDDANELRAAMAAFTALEMNMRGGSAKAWGDKEALKEVRDQLRTVRDRVATYQPLFVLTDDIDAEAAQLTALWVRLIHQAQARYTASKEAEEALDFDDLEVRTAALLRQHEDVRARYLGSEFRHMLVDEFQDTNERQWEIVSLLTQPEQASAAARLFVVGDPKQSIYGFRGADVRVFERVRQLINHHGTDAEIPLVRSFRTHGPLIGWFNHIFERLMVPTPQGPVRDFEVRFGQPMEAHRQEPPGDDPPLGVMLIDRRPRDAAGEYLRDTDGKMLPLFSTAVCREQEAAQLAAWIRQTVDQERPVYDKAFREHRPARYGDVALLLRVTTHFSVYEEALRAQGIDYVTVAGRGYYSRQEVWDVLALLEALYNPEDDLSLATALRSPLFGLSDEALLALRLRHDANGKPLRLWDELSKHSKIAHIPEDERPAVYAAHRILSELRSITGRVTISELIREILAKTGYLATLTALPDGPRRRSNVEKLLGKAIESGRVTLGSFVEYLRDLTLRESREGEAVTEVDDAVTLMTVHSSKGLEFPIVCLPDASYKRFGGDTPILHHHPEIGLVSRVPDEFGEWQSPVLYDQIKHLCALREETEHKRLLYVAATRAQDYLMVSGQVRWDDKSDTWSTNGWLHWLLAALDLSEDRGQDAVIEAAHGNLRLSRPPFQPDSTPTPSADKTMWDVAEVQAGLRLDGDPVVPPLTPRFVPERDRFARNLTATQVADVGASSYDAYYEKRFKNSVLHDAPARVERVALSGDNTSRKIGNIVHEALRWWRFPTREDDMQAVLESYAWRQGIIDAEELKTAVNTARGWLKDLRYTNIYRWLEKSRVANRQSFFELPFVYQTDKRIIHGVIDLLFEKEATVWVLVDYKTSHVSGVVDLTDAAERENQRLIDQHAQRYFLQVGVYAAAVRSYLDLMGVEGIDIEVYIHYLRYKHTVQVTTDQWTNALENLEAQIGKLVE